MTQIIKLTIVVCLLVLLCFVIIAPIIIFIQEAREAKKSHEPRTITPENNSDGEANEFNNELDHINSKYYIHHDFYNLKSQGSLHIISQGYTAVITMPCNDKNNPDRRKELELEVGLI